ncbi:hypothetical protein BaRGS_00018402 [Batillaria attramentaria]|uniref:Uncharacterized protein n=1 Tax=Batillaria attramentaria TaxID=370345 RepID=A0ABD0KTT7_9CAEN
MTKFAARALPSCVPIGRTELFEEVTGRHTVEELENVWIVPGHVFVTLSQGTKLLTFDCKPVTYQHNIDSSTLDFPVLQPPVIDILMVPSMPNVAFVVQENGHVHCWQFSDTFQWSSLREFDLCGPQGSESRKVLSVCLHPKLNSFFWCEQRSSEGSTQHAVCQRQLPDDIEQMKRKGVKKMHTILEQCLASEVVALGDGLLIVPWHNPEHTRVCVFWKPSVLDMASVTTIIGTAARELHDTRSPVDFPSVLMNCLPDLAQMSASDGDHGVKKDVATGNAVLLHSDGTVQIFHFSVGEERKPVRTEIVKISLEEPLPHRKGSGDVWCIHRSVLALTTVSTAVRLYSLPSGQLLREVEVDGGHIIRGLARVHSPIVTVALITDAGVSVVPGGKVHRTPKSQNGLPQEKQFQTDALQVALLSQEREENPCRDVSEQLATLHSKWRDLQAHQPRSQLSDTVDTYLAEFWRLEEMANNLGKSQPVPSPPALDMRAMMHDAIARGHGMVSEAGAAELLWLSKIYPAELLEALLGDLDIEKEHLSGEDQVQWQAKLGLGSGEGRTSAGPANAMTFELVCRLLYQERPQSLVAFVRNAQHVSEQAVGVSAFVRRKHTLQYYVRAIECLPEPSLSKNPQQAATAKAQIILLGEMEHGHELALRFLLQHGHWSEAIHLLQTLSSDSDHRTPLFFLLLQHLVQNQVLADYASEVFALLPSWKSFLAVVKVMNDNPDVQYSQMTASAPALFFSAPPDIPLSALRPHLVSLLNQGNSPPDPPSGQ